MVLVFSRRGLPYSSLHYFLRAAPSQLPQPVHADHKRGQHWHHKHRRAAPNGRDLPRPGRTVGSHGQAGQPLDRAAQVSVEVFSVLV